MFFLNPRILILASLTALAPFAIDTYLPAFEVMEDDLATNSNFIQQNTNFLFSALYHHDDFSWSHI